MGSFYEDAKAIGLKQGPIVLGLFKSYFKRSGGTFLTLSETSIPFRLATTACLICVYGALLIAYTFLNPLVAKADLTDMSRGVGEYLLLFIASAFPLYVVVRPWSGIRSLHFFLNVQLVTAAVASAVMAPLTIIGIELSPRFSMDLQEISEGRGHDTALYAAYCSKTEKQRDMLLMELELNGLTGEFDRPEAKQSIFDSDATRREAERQSWLYLLKEVDREKHLPAVQVDHIKSLRLAVMEKASGLLDDDSNSRISVEYPYVFYLYAAGLLAVPITSLLTYILVWKVFVRSRKTHLSRMAMGIRVVAGALASIAFTFWYFNAMQNLSLHTNISLAEMRSIVREQAQNYPWCRIDPKGLW